MIEVPYQALSEGALQGIIEEYITRESEVTDGSLESKRFEILQQLKDGVAMITYDAKLGSTHLSMRDESGY